MQETQVIQLDGESKVALVFGQMNEPPGARARVALTGLTGMFPRNFSRIGIMLTRLKWRNTSGMQTTLPRLGCNIN
jgi:hypothetical protein